MGRPLPDVDAIGLEVLRQAELVEDVVARHTVVTDQRVGEHEDLAAVRRVRESLRVSHHAGVEHDLDVAHRNGAAEWGEAEAWA